MTGWKYCTEKRGFAPFFDRVLMRLQTLFLPIELRNGNSLYPSVAGFKLWERCLDLYRDKIHRLSGW
jgi:hypothetical protein